MTRAFLLTLAMLAAAGCYNPSPAPNVPCSPGGECPDGQRCDTIRGLCVLPDDGDGIDAGGRDAFVDAEGAIDAMPDAALATPPQFRSVSTVHGSGVMMLVVPAPAGMQAGDLLVAHVGTDNAATSNTLTPQGWSRIVERAGDSNGFTSVVFAHLATAQETSYTFPFSSTSAQAVSIMAFTNSDVIVPIDASASVATASSTSLPIPSVVTTLDNTLLLGFLVEDLATAPFTPPGGMSVMFNEASGTSFVVMGAFEPRPMAGATGPRTATTLDAGPSVGIAVAIRPR